MAIITEVIGVYFSRRAKKGGTSGNIAASRGFPIDFKTETILVGFALLEKREMLYRVIKVTAAFPATLKEIWAGERISF